jgi:hypothetical protein
MAARLGRVLYWAGCLLAALWLAGGCYWLLNNGYFNFLHITAIFIDAVGIWFIGLCCHYLFAGEWKPKK